MDRIDVAVRELVAALRDELTPPTAPTDPVERLLDIPSAARVLGVGRSTVYNEIGAGRLRSVKVGRRRLVPSGAIAAYTRQDAA